MNAVEVEPSMKHEISIPAAARPETLSSLSIVRSNLQPQPDPGSFLCLNRKHSSLDELGCIDCMIKFYLDTKEWVKCEIDGEAVGMESYPKCVCSSLQPASGSCIR